MSKKNLQDDLAKKTSKKTACNCCGENFNFKRRKHHCCKCGEIVCHECLSSKKICSDCSSDLLRTEDSLKNLMAEYPSGFMHRFSRIDLTLGGRKEDWARKYFAISSWGESNVPCMKMYESLEAYAESGEELEMLPLLGCRLNAYSRSAFARVKQAFHWSIQPKGWEEAVVLESSSKDERLLWMTTIIQMGGEDEGVIKNAVANPKAVKEGWLEKCGKLEKATGLQGGWNARYCILAFNPNRLDYYKTFADARAHKVQGTILLNEQVAVSRIQEAYLGMDCSFAVVVSGGRRFLFSAANEAAQTEWVALIGEVRKSVNTNYCLLEPVNAVLTVCNEKWEFTDDEITEQSTKELELKLASSRRAEALEEAEAGLRQAENELSTVSLRVDNEKERLLVLRRVLHKDKQMGQDKKEALKTMREELVGITNSVKDARYTLEEAQETNQLKKQDLIERNGIVKEFTADVVHREAQRIRKDGLLAQFNTIIHDQVEQ